MIQPLASGRRIRVNVLNNGDNVVCEVEETAGGGTRFTAHFLCLPRRPLPSLLTVGETRTVIRVGCLTVPVSMVSMGNPYLFVSATALGVTTAEQLFTAGADLFRLLSDVRREVCQLHSWDPSSAFPKVAALLPDRDQGLVARAISVPSWHPTLALTGGICLGAAALVEGTVAWQLAREAGHTGGPLPIRTPGGALRVDARTLATTHGGPPELAWVSVADKQVHHLGPAVFPAALTLATATREPVC